MISVLLLPGTLHAVPPELTVLRQQYEKLSVERVESVHEAGVGQLNVRYLEAVNRSSGTAKAAGDLTGVLALEDEKKSIADTKTVPDDDDKTLPLLVKLRQVYRAERAKLNEQRASNQAALLAPYVIRLQQLEATLTKMDRVAEAKEVLEYRKGLATVAGVIDPGTPGSMSRATITPAIKGSLTNSLGMKFVPVPGTKVLFCIHETRKADYAAYAAETPDLDQTWKSPKNEGVPISFGDDHPVVDATWEEATAFCVWLSKKEGRTFRLPTDREWSYAVGIGRDERKGIAPRELDGKIADVFPWGAKWPPAEGAGNYADAAAKEKFPVSMTTIIPGYSDGFATTSPVMSFAPNKLGLFDMGGTVWEWCEDWIDDEKKTKVVRGASWSWGERADLLSSNRRNSAPDHRAYSQGFRVVLEEK